MNKDSSNSLATQSLQVEDEEHKGNDQDTDGVVKHVPHKGAQPVNNSVNSTYLLQMFTLGLGKYIRYLHKLTIRILKPEPKFRVSEKKYMKNNWLFGKILFSPF